MNILFVSTEMAPVIQGSGLANVTRLLPPALRKLGHDVRVVLPRYRHVRNSTPQKSPLAAGFLPVGERQEQLRIYPTRHDDVPVYLMDIPAAFERDSLSGDMDDDRRYILYARSVIALMLHLRDVEGWPVEIVHANDWQAGLIPNYLKTYYHYTFGGVAVVYTIHTLAQQGVFNPFTLYLSGLSEGGMVEARAGLRGDSFNFMARGLMFADIISTISPTYSLEILTPECGEGLHHLLQMRHERLAGILHGIDYTSFDPDTDPSIAATFSADDAAGKQVCKAALQQECGLEIDSHRPLLGVVSSLDEQKGLTLVTQALPWLIEKTDAQLVVLGTGTPYFEHTLTSLMRQYPDRVHVQLHSEEASARRIYAGCDVMLMPSRHEPDGSGQLLALRYGCVPVVRAVGGLNDTVREGYEGNGFRFHPYDSNELVDAIRRCLTAFRDTAGWQKLRARGMREDHSWAASAREYIGLYDWARRMVSG